MWYAGTWGTPSQYLSGTVTLSNAQVHTLEVYGMENCCDGAQTLEFNNGTGYYVYSSSNINVVPPQPSSWFYFCHRSTSQSLSQSFRSPCKMDQLSEEPS